MSAKTPRSTPIQQFANEIDNLIERCRLEYDLTYAEAVGVLTMKIQLLCQEAEEEGGDE